MHNDRVHIVTINLISLQIHFLIHTGKACGPRTNTKTPRLIAIMYIVSNTVKYYTIQLFPCSGIKSKEGKQKINQSEACIYRTRTTHRYYLGIGEAAVVLSDPVEPEDEQHGASECAAAPHNPRPPPPVQPRVPIPFAALPLLLHPQRAHAAHEVVDHEYEHACHDAERDQHDRGKRQSRRLRRAHGAEPHRPVRVPPRVWCVPPVQLLYALQHRGCGGRGGGGGGRREERPGGSRVFAAHLTAAHALRLRRGGDVSGFVRSHGDEGEEGTLTLALTPDRHGEDDEMEMRSVVTCATRRRRPDGGGGEGG